MSTILNLLLEEISNSLLGWYLYQFDLTTTFKAIIYIFMNFIFVKGILTFFPFLNPLADFLTLPFRCNNLFSHIHTVRELDIEIKQEARLNPAKVIQVNEEERRVEYGVYNRFELDTRGEGSNFYFSSTSVDDTSKIAMASSKQTVIFFLIYLAILPFVTPLGLIGFIVHMYSSLVLFHALMPSTSDQMMIFYEMMRGGHIPALCMHWFYVVFLVVFIEITIRSGGNALLGLLFAILSTYIYLVFLIFIVHTLSKHFKQNYPILTKIPDSSTNTSDPVKKSRLNPSLSSEMNYD